MSILRNTDGFTSLPSNHPLANLDLTNPLGWSWFEEDYVGYDLTHLIGGNPWAFATTNGTETIGTGAGGLLTLTLGGADNDYGELNLANSPHAIAAGKHLYLQTRVRITLAGGGVMTAGEFFIGLSKLQTTTNFMNAGGTALTVDNALGFVKYDAVGTLNSEMRTVDVESTDGVVFTPVTAVWMTLAIHYDGAKAMFYAGNAADGSDMKLVSTLTGNDPTGVALTPKIWFKAGEAKANILDVDYIIVASQR